ncbi:FUSC family protein [Microbacterium sp. Marseille-Q6965]|uniref:FUSC family protein n=1 Tax=Microbacterium sp. Marseille-Q6965 TaxID=2965072 RepID=UPI0021B71D8C|nr:FUSC family protein [Microbacterium sp. Marseille-Q6965]
MAGGMRRAAAALGRDIVDQPRLLLAAKAAVAASLAWYLAPLIPFAANEYSYYAPLGALVSMYPTLARSARAGLLTLVGLALGIAVGICGLVIVWAGIAGVVAVALVVGLGVALGGIRALGAGREWIAMAGLFTLLLGGRSLEEFSVSYIVTMAFGVVVGIAVNLLLFPPLYVRRASDRLSVLRSTASAQLRKIAEAVESGSSSPDEVEVGLRGLNETAAAVAEEVREADESRRANPRARGRAHEQEQNLRRLRALERTTAATRELAETLVGPDAADLPSSDDVRARLTEAITRAADLVDAAPDDSSGAELLDAAQEAVRRYREAVDAHNAPHPSSADYLLAAALYLQRIVNASRVFV